ncbi:MAG: hypothetical protein K2X86_03145, partial [Cytophagaceae bacterium]|nr:hypothetical protein [Cytophagaceae bacterium]
CAVFYNAPDDMKEEIRGMIGITLKDTMQAIPAGYSRLIINERKVVQAYVKNFLGAPMIYEDIKEYAEEQKLKADFEAGYLEIYGNDKEMFAQVPVK